MLCVRNLLTFPVSFFFLASETKIPLWRWQRMMIFMLANTISCIVTSVLLNVVDHRQVRLPTDFLYTILCVSKYVCVCLSISYAFVFSTGWYPEQDNEKVREWRRQRATQPGREWAKWRWGGWLSQISFCQLNFYSFTLNIVYFLLFLKWHFSN